MATLPTDSAANGTPVAEEKTEVEALASETDTAAVADAKAEEVPASEAKAETDGGAKPKDPPATEESTPAGAGGGESKRWPGWPGDNVFRMIVPVIKVGSIIGRKGELIKKLCEETRARVRILDGPVGTSDRIVLISGREEPEADISPAMDAVLRVFKRINGISDSGADGTTTATGASARLLVASSQAINLIGKQGTLIKSIQESTGATVRVLTGDELPLYVIADERIVEIQGEPLKVLKALEAVVGHLRKFLVDHSVLPLFEKSFNVPVRQDHAADAWADKTQSFHATPQSAMGNEYGLPLKRDSLFLDREPQLDSQIQRSALSLYGQDPAFSGLRYSALGRTGGALVTQITQTMQIPLSYAEDIIGIEGQNIAYIRRTSGAAVNVQESRVLPNELTVEIKGTSTQVQTAQQLIQDFIAGHKEPSTASYGGLDAGLRSSYSQFSSSAYPSSSYAAQPLGGYGSSGLGGYGGYGL